MGLATSFKEADCSSWYPEYSFRFPPAKLIHIDIDPSEIGRNFPVEIGAIADVKQALAVLTKVAKTLYPEGKQNKRIEQEIAAYKKDFKASNREWEESDAFPMSPQRILADIREVLPREAIITTDVGWNKNGVGQQFPIYEPGTFHPLRVGYHGIRVPSCTRCEACRARQSSYLLDWRWRIWPESGSVSDRISREYPCRLCNHE